MSDLIFKLFNNSCIAITIGIVIYNLKIVKIKKRYIGIIVCTHLICVYAINVSNLKLPISFISIVLVMYFITREFYMSVTSIVLTYLITSIGDMVTGLIIMDVFGYNYNIIQNTSYIYGIMHVMFLISNVILSKIMNTVFNKIKLEHSYYKEYIKENMSMVIYAIISLIVLYINSRIAKQFLKKSDEMIASLNIILLAAYFISSIVLAYISIKNVKRKFRYKYKIKELSQLKEYTGMLEELSYDLRKFRHDYINILSSMSSYIEEENYKGLKGYFKKVILPGNISINEKNKNLDLLKNVKFMGLKGLLSSKIIQAQSLDIDVYIDIAEEIDKIAIETIDLCRILGILFDNAIEATKICENKKINFGIIKDESYITIVISNKCSDDVPPMYKLYEKGFSTKGDNRGLGLSIVKDIIDNKYENIFLNTIIGKNNFKQELIIDNKK